MFEQSLVSEADVVHIRESLIKIAFGKLEKIDNDYDLKRRTTT